MKIRVLSIALIVALAALAVPPAAKAHVQVFVAVDLPIYGAPVAPAPVVVPAPVTVPPPVYAAPPVVVARPFPRRIVYRYPYFRPARFRHRRCW